MISHIKCPCCGCEVRSNKEMTISHKMTEMKLYDFKTNKLMYDSSIDDKYEKEITHETDNNKTIIAR